MFSLLVYFGLLNVASFCPLECLLFFPILFRALFLSIHYTDFVSLAAFGDASERYRAIPGSEYKDL